MNSEVRALLNQFASENFQTYKINIQHVAKSDGYMGVLIFISIKGTSKIDLNKKTLSVAVKLQKDNLIDFVKECGKIMFEIEYFLYSKVFPTFEYLQKNLKYTFKPSPECMKCFPEHNILILEDLNVKGYKMHDKNVPMDFEHCKMVVQSFGKFHALSFALKSHNSKVFDKLATHLCDLNEIHSKKSINTSFDVHQRSMREALDLLKEKGDHTLCEAMRSVAASWGCRFDGYRNVDEPQSILTHGDGWNNNIMFCYDENSSLVSVKLIDWQLAGLRTPIYDICLFLYSSCDDFANFDKLIRIYHTSLTKFLVKLKTDPKIFTYEDLEAHLKKYTPYIMMHLPYLLKFVFNDGIVEDVDDSDKDFIRIPPLKRDLYYRRLKPAFQYYVDTYVK